MALLQKIRKRAGVFVIIFVGVALVLFIVDPTTFQALFAKNETSIAEINGDDAEYEEFQEYYNGHRDFLLVAQQKGNLEADEDQRIREQAWNDILQKYLLEPYYEEVGLSVSEAELEDLLYGSNIHYVITQNFTNQQTGQVDTVQIRNFFDSAADDPNYAIIAEYWKEIIQRDRISTKYNNMVAKGFYTPVALAKMDYEESNNLVDFEYVYRAYKDIADEDMKVTDSDIKKYYDNHQYMFIEAKPSRDIEYVVFNVIPSAEDTAAIYADVEAMYVEFNELEEGYLDYASRYSEFKAQDKFISELELPTGLSPEFYEQEVGTTSEIIAAGNTFFFTRIVEVAERPDSAMASHILIIPNDSVTIEECYAKADSLKRMIEEGEDFATLAFMNSEDPGSQQTGGDLGWFTDGMMVPQFNEVCFTSELGTMEIVETQFGVHLILVTEKTEPNRKIKIATVNKEIRFSDRTANLYFSEASTFSANNTTGKKFDAAIIEGKLVKRIASKLSELDNQISGIENAREIVRWAYEEETSEGSVSSVFNFESEGKFIVAQVSAIREKGVAPLEYVKELIKPIVLKDKKAALLMSELNKDISGSMDLMSIAGKYNKVLDTLTNVSFSSFSLPGIGIEPNVNAVAANMEVNKMSKPIKGNNGVFVIRVVNMIDAPEKTDFSTDQLSVMKNQASQVYKLFEAIEKNAEITDNRARYF